MSESNFGNRLWEMNKPKTPGKYKKVEVKPFVPDSTVHGERYIDSVIADRLLGCSILFQDEDIYCGCADKEHAQDGYNDPSVLYYSGTFDHAMVLFDYYPDGEIRKRAGENGAPAWTVALKKDGVSGTADHIVAATAIALAAYDWLLNKKFKTNSGPKVKTMTVKEAKSAFDDQTQDMLTDYLESNAKVAKAFDAADYKQMISEAKKALADAKEAIKKYDEKGATNAAKIMDDMGKF